jgi:hypothetical protein
MLVRAFRLAENLAILSLLTASAVALHVAAARARRLRDRIRLAELPGE